MLNNFTTQANKKRRARQIKAQLILAGVKHQEIAKRAGVVPSLVTAVINNDRKSIRVRAAIAVALHTTVETLWPPNNSNTKAA